MKKSELLKMLNYWLQPKAVLLRDYSDYLLDAEPVFNDATGLKDENPKRRIFIDRDSDILFVAHIDTVKLPILKKHKDNVIWASGLDDRLGCGIAEMLAREYGADLLICDYEESASTSGGYHNFKEYNWIAEFDRNGGDVVTYDLDSKEWLEALEKHFTIGIGAFSDVCFFETEACCVNIGIGYALDHSDDSYVNLNILNSQINKFRNFYEEFKYTAFEQDDNIIKNYWYDPQYGYGQSFGGYYDEICEFCGNDNGQEIYNYCICVDCFEKFVSDWLMADYTNKY